MKIKKEKKKEFPTTNKHTKRYFTRVCDRPSALYIFDKRQKRASIVVK